MPMIWVIARPTVMALPSIYSSKSAKVSKRVTVKSAFMALK